MEVTKRWAYIQYMDIITIIYYQFWIWSIPESIFCLISYALDVVKRGSLTYTHQNIDDSIANGDDLLHEEIAKTILNEYKSSASHNEHPNLFTDLVYALRRLNYSQLSDIFSKITDAATKR